MSVSSAAALAKDVAALLAGVSLLLAAAILWSQAGAVTAALAISAAAAAAGGVAAIAVAGLGGALGAPPLWIALAVAALFVALAFWSALTFGVRGLWLTSAAGLGAAFGAVLLILFARAGVAGAAGPLVALGLLALLGAGGLGAAAAAPEARARTAADLLRPPAWFDCAYGALGGTALGRGRCAFAPPVARTYLENTPALAPDTSPARQSFSDGEAGETRPLAAPDALADAPPPPTDLAEDAPPPDMGGRHATSAPLKVSAGPAPEVAAAQQEPQVSRDPGAVPTPPRTALAPNAAPSAPDQDAVASPDTAAAMGAVAVRAAYAAPPAQDGAPASQVGQVGGSDRRRSAFVCFPLLGAHAEQLCPDRRFDPGSVSVSWSAPGGRAAASVDSVECALDRSAVSHVSFVIGLPTDPNRRLSRGEGGGEAVRSGDALHLAMTRFLSAARAGVSLSELYLSAVFLNGSRLSGAWAGHDLGVERSDRLFSVTSGAQTLALLRRLKAEAGAAKPQVSAKELLDGLNASAQERPEPTSRATQAMTVLLLDAAAVETPNPDQIEAAARVARKAGGPLFVVALTEDGAAPEALSRLAEAAGGAAYGAGHLAGLTAALENVVLRARSFCAVRVSAPESFFEDGPVEIMVRRQMSDGCKLRQVAALSCGAAELRNEIETAPQAAE